MATRSRRRILIAMLTAVLAMAALLVPLPVGGPPPQSRAVLIEARSFAYQPATIHVNRGDRVTIDLMSLDAVHGLSIDGYGVNINAEPGRNAQVTFVADREGKFKMRCSVTCGALHPFMIGEMVVAPHTAVARSLLATLIVTVGAAGVVLLRLSTENNHDNTAL